MGDSSARVREWRLDRCSDLVSRRLCNLAADSASLAIGDLWCAASGPRRYDPLPITANAKWDSGHPESAHLIRLQEAAACSGPSPGPRVPYTDNPYSDILLFQHDQSSVSDYPNRPFPPTRTKPAKWVSAIRGLVQPPAPPQRHQVSSTASPAPQRGSATSQSVQQRAACLRESPSGPIQDAGSQSTRGFGVKPRSWWINKPPGRSDTDPAQYINEGPPEWLAKVHFLWKSNRRCWLFRPSHQGHHHLMDRTETGQQLLRRSTSSGRGTPVPAKSERAGGVRESRREGTRRASRLFGGVAQVLESRVPSGCPHTVPEYCPVLKLLVQVGSALLLSLVRFVADSECLLHFPDSTGGWWCFRLMQMESYDRRSRQLYEALAQFWAIESTLVILLPFISLFFRCNNNLHYKK